jgi:para-aminobenzoate synthetase component 1
MTNKSSIKEQMNLWAGAGVPFLFIIDFELNKPLIFKLKDIDPEKLLFSIYGVSNCPAYVKTPGELQLVKHPEKYEDYLEKFNKVMEEISFGNSYLLNLTCATPIDLNLSLKEIFLMSNAKYRIWYEEQFVCFSPEIFVTIKDGIIKSFPMKGTIDAAIPGAEKIILSDFKETAEHYTIVDLIRNDLNTVSERVRVERFRYIDTIVTSEKKLLQVSSEICGDLEKNYLSHIGDIIYALLPAGSVSGAPKRRTTEIISATETENRGYYTGVFGIFDGRDIDSCVLIRYIEKSEKSYIYRSGGGITSFSTPLAEYNEMIDKIYVPIV